MPTAWRTRITGSILQTPALSRQALPTRSRAAPLRMRRASSPIASGSLLGSTPRFNAGPRRLAPFAGVKLIAYHNSWPYFARRFRLDVVDFIEPKPGVAPSPAHLAKLIAQGRQANVRAIVHEPYEPEDSSRLLAQKLDVPFVLLATSVGSVAGVNDYLALFEHNTATLANALGGSGE
jgi:hypothetical protein